MGIMGINEISLPLLYEELIIFQFNDDKNILNYREWLTYKL